MVRTQFVIWPVSLIAFLAVLNVSCSRRLDVVVWDFRKGTKPADIGWHPKNRLDVGYHKSGDIDFTFIDTRGWTFHQRCTSIGAMRDVQRDEISYVYAHFAPSITLDEAEPLIIDVLTKWSGGLRSIKTEQPPDFVDFMTQWRAGRIPEGTQSYIVAGKDSGIIRITIFGTPSQGGKAQCSLMFSPGS